MDKKQLLQAEFQEEKNGFENERNFSWRSVTATLSAFELRQNWGTHEIQLEVRFIQRKGGLILLEKDAQTTLQNSSSSYS